MRRPVQRRQLGYGVRDVVHPANRGIARLSRYLPEATPRPFRFLQLPKELRLLVLEQILRPRCFNRVYVSRPNKEPSEFQFLFSNQLLALRRTSKLVKEEAEYVFISSNDFFFNGLSEITFLRRKNSFLQNSLQHITLGQDALAVDIGGDKFGPFNKASRVLAALRTFTSLRTLNITLPWENNGISNPEFQYLIDLLVANVSATKLVVTRPNLQYLLPDYGMHLQSSSIPHGSEFRCISTFIKDRPKIHRCPLNALQILDNDIDHMRRINHRNQRLGDETRLQPSAVTTRLLGWLSGKWRLPPAELIKWDYDINVW